MNQGDAGRLEPLNENPGVRKQELARVAYYDGGVDPQPENWAWTVEDKFEFST